MKIIKPGICPNCNCEILEKNSNGQFVDRPNSLYAELWVLYNDNSNAMFTVCKNCFPKLTLEDVTKINNMQKYTWGLEIINTPMSFLAFSKQLQWYIGSAVTLDVVKFAKSKEELK